MTDDRVLEKAIEDLRKYFERAENNPCIEKPVAWALYKTWRKYNVVAKEWHKNYKEQIDKGLEV